MGETLSPLLLARYPVIDRDTLLMTRPWIQYLLLLGGTTLDLSGSVESLDGFEVLLSGASGLGPRVDSLRAAVLGLEASPQERVAAPVPVVPTALEPEVPLWMGWRHHVEGMLAAMATERDAVNSTLWNGQRVHTESFTMTGTGFTVNPTGTALVVQLGRFVALFVPELTGTSNATTFTLTGLPVALQPTQTAHGVIAARQNNGAAFQLGVYRLNAGNTVIELFINSDLAGWTAANAKALRAMWILYALL